MKVKIDGKEFEVNDELGKKINDMLEKEKEKEDGLSALEVAMKSIEAKLDGDEKLKALPGVDKKVDALFGRCDELKAKLEMSDSQLQAKLDQAEKDMKEMQVKNDEYRADAEKRAASVLGGKVKAHMPGEYKADGKTCQEIMRDFIAHHDSNVDIKAKNDIYVEARFDAMIDQFSKSEDRIMAMGEKLLGRTDGREMKTDADVESARKAAIDRQKNAYKGKE